MNNKTLYIFAGLFAGLLFVFFALQKFGPTSGEDTTKSFALPSLRPGASAKAEAAEFTRVEINRSKDKERERLIFERTDRGWKMLNPAARADFQAVNRLIDQVRNAHKEDVADLGTNLAELGLDPPQMIITLTNKDGKEYRVNVGNQSAGKPESAVVYVNSSETAEPMAVKRSQIDNAFRDVSDFLQLDLLGVSELNTAYLQIEGPGRMPAFAMEKKMEGDFASSRWYFTNPASLGEAEKENAPPPPDPPPHYDPPISGVKGVLEAVGNIQNIRGTAPVAVNASEADLAKYGLEADNYATMRIEVKRTGENSVQAATAFRQPVTEAILIGKKFETDAKNQGERYYARRADERVILLVPGKPISQILPVLAKSDLLQCRDLANLDRQKIDAIDVKTPEGLAKLRHCGVPEAWRVYGTTSPGEADQKTVRSLLDAIISRRTVTAFPPEKPDAEYGFDKPAAVVTAWQSSIIPDREKAKDDPNHEPVVRNEPVVELTFGKTDKDSIYVKRKEGKTTRIVAVPATVMARIALPPIGFANRALPSFTLDQAVKLEVVRDGKMFSLENKAKEGSHEPDWQIVAPKEEAGPADARVVNDLLAELSRLHPTSLAAEKTDDLDRFGLKSPAVKATVTLRKDGRNVSYLFGKETEDHKGVFGKQGERPVVYVVSPDALKPLRADLGDRSIFHFELGKVKELTLSGWKKLGKGPQTLRLARGDKGWDVKDAPIKDFVVNPTIVEDLLGEKLAKLSTDKFVVRRAGAEPKHQVDEANQALRITITVDGIRDPLTLTIGGLDAEQKAYFATASTRPGDVFLLPQRAYEEILKEGAAYFKK
jgi:hypothetical protein